MQQYAMSSHCDTSWIPSRYLLRAAATAARWSNPRYANISLLPIRMETTH
jgi:hypothetical protein